MKTSPKGINLIKEFEGLRLNAYLCPANIWTIGYGITQINGNSIQEGDNISEEEAETLLIYEIQRFEAIVLNRLEVPVNQNQFDALVSHTFNTGGSDILFELINNNAPHEEIRQWMMSSYITANGVTLNGLIKRRKIEAELFLSDFI
jgi:lysozyme